MCGSFPSAIHLPSRCGSMPSNPRITIFLSNLDAGRAALPEQADVHSATPAAAIARAVLDLRIGCDRIITFRHGAVASRRATRAAAPARGAGLHDIRRRLARTG